MSSPGFWRLVNLSCFLGSACLAAAQEWSVPEFCWGTWVTSLFFSMLCVLSGYLHLAFTLGRQLERISGTFPAVLSPESPVPRLLLLAAGTVAALAAWFVYLKLYAFYGLFLSVFAEMKPLSLFGRNGFINSDFYTPVFYLARKFWPVMLFASISSAGAFLGPDPWIKIVMPFKSREMARIHLMTLALPFLSVLFWIVFRERYHAPVVIVMLAIFYFVSLPGKDRSPVPANGPGAAR